MEQYIKLAMLAAPHWQDYEHSTDPEHKTIYEQMYEGAAWLKKKADLAALIAAKATASTQHATTTKHA